MKNGGKAAMKAYPRAAWTVQELAHTTGVTVQAVYKAIRIGALPRVQVGGRLVIPATALASELREALALAGTGKASQR